MISHVISIVARHKVPHYYLVALAELYILLVAYDTMRRAEKIAMQKGVGTIHIVYILLRIGKKALLVVEGVVAYAMTGIDHHAKFVGEFMHIVAHHEEGRLHIVTVEHAQHPRGNLGDGPVVKGQVHRLFIGIYSPDCLRIQSSEKGWYLFYKHTLRH